MSEKTTQSQTQHERWLKYGANVVVSSLIVIALAALLTYLAQAHAKRIDTTIGGTQSLRPQTLNFIQDLKTKIHIVALYPRLKGENRQQDYYQPVADLLNEYTSKGKNITAEMFDPDTEKDRFNKLVSDVTNRYGGEVKGYKSLLEDLPAQSDIISKFATEEAEKFKALPLDQVQDSNAQQEIYTAYLTIVSIPAQLKRLKASVDNDLDQQIPSYKDGVDDARTAYTNISQLLEYFAKYMDSAKSSQSLPKEIAAYAAGASTRPSESRKAVAAMLDRMGHLNELKQLNEFRDQLKSNSILVMSDSGYKILQFNQVWKTPESNRFVAAGPDVTPRLTFAGEQQISMAIASLSSGAKRMVVFVRPGGPPLAAAAGIGQPGPFAAVAQRLADYNFDVQDRDVSGQWAQQQEQPTPEPTDEQMKSAIWVVLRSPRDSMMGPSPISGMLDKHLKEGGSAMVLLFPQCDAMAEVLGPWGLNAKTDEVIVHEALPPPARRSLDMAENAMQQTQIVFMLNQYGDHPLAKPLEGLDFLSAGSCPVSVDSTLPGIKAVGLLPMPSSPSFWATSDVTGALESHSKLVFNPKANPDGGRPVGDEDNTPAHPLFAAGASEKEDGGRVMVVGSYEFLISDLIELPDNDMMEKHGVNVARLPGNGEFFVDGILWLAHQDALLAISPHALQVARLKDMSQTTLNIWHIGVLTAGLPAIVIVAGLLVYMRRRD